MKRNTCQKVKSTAAKSPRQALSTAPTRRPRDPDHPGPAEAQPSRHSPSPRSFTQQQQPRTATRSLVERTSSLLTLIKLPEFEPTSAVKVLQALSDKLLERAASRAPRCTSLSRSSPQWQGCRQECLDSWSLKRSASALTLDGFQKDGKQLRTCCRASQYEPPPGLELTRDAQPNRGLVSFSSYLLTRN